MTDQAVKLWIETLNPNPQDEKPQFRTRLGIIQDLIHNAAADQMTGPDRETCTRALQLLADPDGDSDSAADTGTLAEAID